MSAESLTEQERALIRKLTSAPLFFDSNFERWILDRVMLNFNKMPVEQALHGRGVTRSLFRSTTPVTVTSATETTVYEFDIPGKRLGTNGKIQTVFAYKYTNNTGGTRNLTIRCKLGGVTLFTEVNTVGSPQTDTPEDLIWTMLALDSFSSQEHRFEKQAASWALSSVDMSQSQKVTFTAQWSIGDASMTGVFVGAEILNNPQ